MAAARAPRPRRPRAPRRARRMPPHELRATRGPQPPDAIIAELQALVRAEFATVSNRRTDALGSAFLDRFKASLASAARRVIISARSGVARVLSPEKAKAVPTGIPQDLYASFVQRVIGSVTQASPDAALSGAESDAARAAAEKAADRAANIVREETTALHSEAVQHAARAAGVQQYVWTTRLDEIVREGHATLEGTIQRWDDPPVTDDNGYRAHPGEPKFCRCQAYPWEDL